MSYHRYRQQGRRVVRFRVMTRVLASEICEVKPINDFNHEASQMILCEPVIYRRRLLPRTLNLAGAKRLLCTFSDQLLRTSGTQIHTLIATVTASIATLRLPFRPNRVEPRTRKRRPKSLPLLTVPRQVARGFIFAQRGLNRVLWGLVSNATKLVLLTNVSEFNTPKKIT